MDVAYISALSALAGSAIGGLTSGFATWLNQRFQAKAETLGMNRRAVRTSIRNSSLRHQKRTAKPW
jgi:hypothetical protein